MWIFKCLTAGGVLRERSFEACNQQIHLRVQMSTFAVQQYALYIYLSVFIWMRNLNKGKKLTLPHKGRIKAKTQLKQKNESVFIARASYNVPQQMNPVHRQTSADSLSAAPRASWTPPRPSQPSQWSPSPTTSKRSHSRCDLGPTILASFCFSAAPGTLNQFDAELLGSRWIGLSKHHSGVHDNLGSFQRRLGCFVFLCRSQVSLSFLLTNRPESWQFHVEDSDWVFFPGHQVPLLCFDFCFYCWKKILSVFFTGFTLDFHLEM